MKIVVIEPLGVDKSQLEELAAGLVPDAKLVCYDSRSEDAEELIKKITNIINFFKVILIPL